MKADMNSQFHEVAVTIYEPKVVQGIQIYLQGFNNPIYDLGFNKRLISLNIDNNIIFLFKLLKSFIASLSTCKFIRQYDLLEQL